MDYLYLIVICFIFVIFRKYSFKLWNVIHLFPRDLRILLKILQVKIIFSHWRKNNYTVPQLFTRTVTKYPSNIALKFNDESWTFQKLDKWSNKIARYFFISNLRNDNNVLLIMEPTPEFICVLLGLMKIGIPVTIVNATINMDQIQNCFALIKYNVLIIGQDYREKYFDNKINTNDYNSVLLLEITRFDNDYENFAEQNAFTNLSTAIIDIDDDPFLNEVEERDFNRNLFFFVDFNKIKLIEVQNSSFIHTVIKLYYLSDIKQTDIIHSPLSISHKSGSILSLGLTLLTGTTSVFSSQFSIRNFWQDCIKNNCTVIQYCGNMCRYLLTAPENLFENHNHIRLMFGCGLESEIWKKFSIRFNIKNIYEFYSTINGHEILVNINAKMGALGIVPNIFQDICQVSLIKINEITKTPVQSKNNKLIRCKVNEAGLLLIKSNANSNNELNSDTKSDNIITNVFKNGDCYIKTNDLVYTDHQNYLYYIDNLNYILMYKDKMVSSKRLESIISTGINFRDVAYYPVKVNSMNENRGMIAIEDLNGLINISYLQWYMKNHLKFYEMPTFIRLMSSLLTNDAFEIQKDVLQNDGFNILCIKDKIYYYDLDLLVYLPLTKSVYLDILTGLKKI